MHPLIEKSTKVVIFECSTIAWQARVKLAQLTSVTFKNRPQNAWNILKVFQFIAVANNNCIHVNKGEI